MASSSPIAALATDMTAVEHAARVATNLPQVPQELLGARELHDQMRAVSLNDRYDFLSRYFGGLAARRQNGYPLGVAGPFGPRVDHVEMNRQRLRVLERVYGPIGHNALLAGLDAAVAKARNGSVLTWNLHTEGVPEAVATASIKLHAGSAELCSAASDHPEFPGSVVQYRRLEDFLGNPTAYRVFCLESELRASAAYVDPTGQAQPSSAPTQHNNVFLAPWLLTSGVVYTDARQTQFWVEAQVDSRFFIQPEGVNTVLFTPEVNPADMHGPTIADIAMATYQYALGVTPDIISSAATDMRSDQSISDRAFSPPRVAVKISGIWAEADLNELIRNEEKRSHMLEFAVLNHPDTIELQRKLYKRGFIPVGVWPGGEFTVQGHHVVEPTYFHFQRPRTGLRFQLMPYELARDYSDSPIDNMMARLAAYWRQIYP